MVDWKGLAAKVGWAGLGMVVLALILLVGECRSFKAASAMAQKPTLALPTALETRSEKVTLPPGPVEALNVSERDSRRIEKKYGVKPAKLAVKETNQGLVAEKLPEIGQVVLGERVIESMPNGGTALLTRSPEGRVEMIVVANPDNAWSFQSVYEAGAVFGLGSDGEKRGRAWVAAEPMRFARLHLRAEVGIDLRAGQSDAYAMAGVVWRSQ